MELLTRVALVLLLTLASALVAFVLGASYSAVFVVGPEHGPAGAAEVVLHGSIVALVAAIVMLVVALRLDTRRLAVASLGLGTLALLFATAIAVRYLTTDVGPSQQQRELVPTRPGRRRHSGRA